MSRIDATAAEWLEWESQDRRSAWEYLREVAAQCAGRVGARFRMQPADREDLAGDVLFVAIDSNCTRVHGLDPRVSLRAWLFGVARNLALERSRLRTAVAVDCDDLNARDGIDVPSERDSGAARAPSPLAKIDRLLKALTPAQREVELALLAGLSERAIARKLKISRNAVRERVARGRRRLRRAIAETDRDDAEPPVPECASGRPLRFETGRPGVEEPPL